MNDANNEADLCPRCMTPLGGQRRCPSCRFEPGTYTPPRHHLPPLTILDGKYLVGCAMGEGGFGITYVGWDLQLHSMVAIKEYFPTGIVFRDNTQSNAVSVFAGSSEAHFLHDRARFLEEARMLARFDGHPGVVNVKNDFMENGTAYIVMEYILGINLAVLAEQNGGKLPFGQAMSLLSLPIQTLGEMHRRNTFHRDISPENLMVTRDGTVKLIDFGSAKTNADDKSRFLKVRSGYSALEMYGDESREGAYSDIYSLCATLYRLVTGVTPPPAADRARRDTLLPPIRAGAEGMSPEQERALLKGMALRPEDRFQRVEDLSEALSGKGRRRRMPRWLLPAVAAAHAAALGLLLFFKGRPERFELTEDMFAGAPELWACYRDDCGYPQAARAYITVDGIRFTWDEGDDDWSGNEWRRDRLEGARLKRMLDTLRASGIPIGEFVLQNLRLEALDGLDEPWPNPVRLIFDQCELPADWNALGGMGDSLVSLHVGGECDNSDLSWMSSLTGLHWLALGGDIDLESVSKMDWLPGLSFGGCDISDLTPFTRMKSLTSLCLFDCQIRDLSPLADMPWLEYLEIPDNDVEDLTPLADLKALKQVNLRANRITDFSPIERDGILIEGREDQNV